MEASATRRFRLLVILLPLGILAGVAAPPASAGAVGGGNPVTIEDAGAIEGTAFADVIVGSTVPDAKVGLGGNHRVCSLLRPAPVDHSVKCT